MAMVLGSNAP